MNTTDYRWPVARERAERLQKIMDGYEIGEEGEPDSSVPGAARILYTIADPLIVDTHPRYVLVTQYGDKGNYRLYLANDLANVEQLAADAVRTDELVSCYFDLDELADPHPDLPTDERMPVRYGLAKVVVSVAFNTIPSP